MGLRVNGEYVDDGVIRAEATALRPQHELMIQDMDPIDREMQLRDWSRENVIERVLLRQEALADPEPVPEAAIDAGMAARKQELSGQPGCEFDEAELRREAELAFRLERLIGRLNQRVAAPKTKDVLAYYKKHRDRFWAPERIRAAHIVKHVNGQDNETKSRESIERAKAELDGGADFASVADRYSDCAGNGGDLGYFPRGEMVDEFDNVVFQLDPGQTSGIFRTVFGYHIARVLDRKPEGTRPFDEVQTEITALLLREKQERAMEQYLDQLRAKAVIETVRGQA